MKLGQPDSGISELPQDIPWYQSLDCGVLYNSGADEAPAYPATWEGGPQIYRILKFWGDFFELDPILSTASSTLDPGCRAPPPPPLTRCGSPHRLSTPLAQPAMKFFTLQRAGWFSTAQWLRYATPILSSKNLHHTHVSSDSSYTQRLYPRITLTG
jgi:hypothetical protein